MVQLVSDALVPIIVAVLAILGGTGYWGYRQSRKEAPVKKRDADLAAAEKSQQMALAVAGDLRTDLIRLRADLDAERAARGTLSDRVDELGKRINEQSGTIRALREGLRMWANAWDNLVRNWDTLRLLDQPPEQPKVNFDQLPH